MDSNIILSLLYGIMFVAGVSLTGTEAHQRNCNKAEFWNSDVELCVPCSECVEFPKTPSCDTCTFMDDTSYAWKLAAITSFSVLAVLILCGMLLAGVLVHQYRSRKRRTLREPIEETTGPLYQV